MKFFMQLLRVKHWVKNTFIFFPLIFSGQLFEGQLLVKNLFVFMGFCLVSSSLYVLNDFLDMKQDRVHPKKAMRPLAQKHINPLAITALIIALLTAGFFLCQKGGNITLLIVGIYILLNLTYNFYTKKIVIMDVISIAFGFHLRIWAGAAASQILPSVWLQMCVFLLALFLGFTKRRYEISTLKSRASEHRSVLAHYTAYLLDQIIIICSTLAIIFYGLYTISPEIINRLGNQNIVYSLVFVIYGIFRYLYLIHVRKLGDDPADVLFSDMPLMTCIILWVCFISTLIYVL